MISYELAKELKEAGFFQGPKDGNHHGNGTWFSDSTPVDHEGSGESTYRPCLHELIEACGKQFRNLAQHEDGEWTASMYGEYNAQVGSTPSEAVARLYLALNKK